MKKVKTISPFFEYLEEKRFNQDKTS